MARGYTRRAIRRKMLFLLVSSADYGFVGALPGWITGDSGTTGVTGG
jgi:hypothetical protein